MTLDEALRGKEFPREIRETLALVEVPYISFAGARQQGHLVIHESLAEEVREIFASLTEQRFPIAKVVPISEYDWDDEASMADNNSSAFNYRNIANSDQLSKHSFGRALDINPLFNPYVRQDGVVAPHGATYDPGRPGTITEDIARLFTDRGWTWGGAWTNRKDWQHFEKP